MDEELAGWLHSKNRGQQLYIQLENSDESHSSEAVVGVHAV